MQRRQFLASALAAGATASLRPWRALADSPLDPYTSHLDLTLTRAQDYGESILNAPASQAPIDTIVIVMMENRSFDHYLGWLATDATYLEAGRRRYGRHFSVDGQLDAIYQRPDGSLARTYHLPTATGETNPWRGCGHPDPGHGRDSGLRQWHDGFVSDGSGNDDYALGYFLGEDVPVFAELAREHTIFDRSFCSLLAGTYPNRFYLHAGTSMGDMHGSLPSADSPGYTWPTISDRLLAAGVQVGTYFTDLPVVGFWGPRLLPTARPIADFFVDAAAGQLPNVVYVDPGFMSGMRTDDHPHGDMRTAQAFLATVVRAFQQSPHWERGALFITYDEWGGFFDHVAPVHLSDERTTADENTDFSLTGFRIPTLLASPFAKRGFVDHRTYDHASILRFLEWRFLGAPREGPRQGSGSPWWLSQRDRYANNIGASLQKVRQTDAMLEARVPVTASLPCDGQYFQDVPGLVDLEDSVLTPAREAAGLQTDGLDGGGLSPEGPEPSLSDPRVAELFSSYGYRIGPSTTLAELTTG